MVTMCAHLAVCASVSANPTTGNPTPVQATNSSLGTTVLTTTPATDIIPAPNDQIQQNASQPGSQPNEDTFATEMTSTSSSTVASTTPLQLTTLTTALLPKPTKASISKTTKKDTRRKNGRNGGSNGKNGAKTQPNGKVKKQATPKDVGQKKQPTQTKKPPQKPPRKPPQKSPEPKPAQSGFEDDFFNIFETTTSVSANEPPPDFDPNKTGTKVMPKVDANSAMGYDGSPCNETYKPHETIKTKYMMRYAEGVWGEFDCPPNLSTGLVWRQDLCSCGEELVAQDPDDWCAQIGFNEHPDNKHKYFRRHHGIDAAMDCAANLVWSQRNCLCMYDPTVAERPIEHKVMFVCKTILNLTFEGNLKNSAGGYHVQPVKLQRRGKLPRIRYMTTAGATGKAAMIVSQPLEFQAFRGNDFQTKVTYTVNFKISPHHLTRDTFMTLFTDECKDFQGGQSRERKPGISLQFKPATNTFRLQFRTDTTEIDELITGAKPDEYGWYRIVLYLEDSTLNLENNGHKVYSRTAIEGKVPQNRCPLYIAGRGQGFDRSEDFYGYMDNIFLVKDCRFHEANIKIL